MELTFATRLATGWSNPKLH